MPKLKHGANLVVGRVINLKGERLQALRDSEQEFLADGKLEAGRGPWRAAGFHIRKKYGKQWLARDYSRPRKMLQWIPTPCGDTRTLPLSEQSKGKVFSKVDLQDAFPQVAMVEESRRITNVHVPGGFWQWTVVPQGINVGPALLQRDIDTT